MDISFGFDISTPAFVATLLVLVALLGYLMYTDKDSRW